MTEFPKYLLRISLFECPVKWKSGSLSVNIIGKCKKTAMVSHPETSYGTYHCAMKNEKEI